jgi:subtilisin family serine protease
MPEEKKPKIVLYKEDIDGRDFATVSVEAANVVDAFEVMMTDFVPEINDVPVNDEGKFFVANLTDSEAREMADKSEVEDVVDDIEVFALEQTPLDPMEGEDGFDDDLALGELELDPEDIEALEEDPYPEWNPEDPEDILLTPEEARLLTQLDPSVTEEDIELEHQLLEGTLEGVDEVSAERIWLPKIPIPREKLIKLVKCILKCMLEQGGKAEEMSDEDIEAMLRSAGAEEEVLRRRDIILPNIRQIYAPQAWRYSTGAGVRVAVVDTGIDPRHPDLRVYGGVSYVPGVTSWRDDHGHGTHCAGIIAASINGRGIVGVAPRARLYAVKVLNRRGSGMLSWILNGLMWCYRAGMHVVSLSLGSRERTHDPNVYNKAYEHVGRILRRRGILCIAAAGNDYHRPVGNPARCPSYMAVSAIDSRRRLATFTSVGPQVEICAPGVNILSTVPGGYRRMSGTSMACPHVSGVAALVKSRRRTWHGDRIRVHMWKTAFDLGTPGRDWAFGYGQVNAFRAVR